MEKKFCKTSYIVTKKRKACQFTPKLEVSSDIRKKFILCQYDDSEGKETEIIPMGGLCIIPVSSSDTRNLLVEKGYYYTISLDEEGKEFKQITTNSVKIYVDDDSFRKIVFTF